MPNRRRLSRAALASLLALATWGCEADDEPDAAASCASVVHDAAFVAEIDDQIRLLDEALVICPSQAIFNAEMSKYPGILGYSNSAFTELRCSTDDADAGVRNGRICQEIAPPATTVPPDQLVEYVADTYDGERIIITPDDVEFDGDVPIEIRNTVAIASNRGCTAVYARRDGFLARSGDNRAGQILSVYALHAERVAQFIGCVDPTAGTTVPPTTTPPE